MTDPAQTTNKTIGVIAALMSAVLFGLNAVGSKQLFAPPPVMDATALFVARGAWSLPLFLGLAILARPRPIPAITQRDILLFLMSGATFGPGSIALSALGAASTSAAHAVMLLSLFPPLAAFLASIFLRENLSRLAIASVVVGVSGALFLALSRSAGGSSWYGDALIAGFIFTWALLTLGIRQLDAKYPALFVVGVFGTIGALMLVLMGFAMGRADAILIPAHRFDFRTVLWFDLELVVFLSVVAQLLQAAALRNLPVAFVVALTSYGSIFAGLIASVTLLGETISPSEWIAGVLLLGALGLSLMDRYRAA
ncbi:MAG TPA: DMT family transporter [Rhizomicrobium sp.]|nr:DMT family transporter [Rhizomicrobium sp.]